MLRIVKNWTSMATIQRAVAGHRSLTNESNWSSNSSNNNPNSESIQDENDVIYGQIFYNESDGTDFDSNRVNDKYIERPTKSTDQDVNLKKSDQLEKQSDWLSAAEEENKPSPTAVQGDGHRQH